MKNKEYYKNHLPHIVPLGGTFFVTFCTQESIPFHKFIKKQSEDFVEAFSKFDFIQDKLKCKVDLTSSKIVDIIQSELHENDKKQYCLKYYCVMPNHVHLVIDTNFGNPLPLKKVMNNLKGRMSYYINKELNKSGTFWQRESFDHLIVSEKELLNCGSYTLNNPQKAILVDYWNEWPHLYYEGM